MAIAECCIGSKSALLLVYHTVDIEIGEIEYLPSSAGDHTYKLYSAVRFKSSLIDLGSDARLGVFSAFNLLILLNLNFKQTLR